MLGHRTSVSARCRAARPRSRCKRIVAAARWTDSRHWLRPHPAAPAGHSAACVAEDLARTSDIRRHDRQAGGRRFQQDAAQRLLPRRMHVDRQLAQQAVDIRPARPANARVRAAHRGPPARARCCFERTRLPPSASSVGPRTESAHPAPLRQHCAAAATNTSVPFRSPIWPIVPTSRTLRSMPSSACRYPLGGRGRNRAKSTPLYSTAESARRQTACADTSRVSPPTRPAGGGGHPESRSDAGAELDDVAQMPHAGHVEVPHDRPRQARHGDAVGVHHVRVDAAESTRPGAHAVRGGGVRWPCASVHSSGTCCHPALRSRSASGPAGGAANTPLDAVVLADTWRLPATSAHRR